MKMVETEVGRRVVYTPPGMTDSKYQERGVITKTNNKYVFVRFGDDINSKAVKPDYLQYE